MAVPIPEVPKNNSDREILMFYNQVKSVIKKRLFGLPVYASNALALAGGLEVGDFYQTGGNPSGVCVVV